jgi:MFS family permease
MTALPTVDAQAVLDSQKTILRLGLWRKHMILFIVSWNALVVTSTSTCVFITSLEIAIELATTPEIINITNAGVLIAMGCSSLLWSPVARLTSLRRSYNASLVFLFLTSIGTVLSPTMACFTAMRVLTGLVGTWFMVAGQIVITGIFVPTERGLAVGCLMVGSVAGTALGMFPGPILFRQPTHVTDRTLC